MACPFTVCSSLDVDGTAPLDVDGKHRGYTYTVHVYDYRIPYMHAVEAVHVPQYVNTLYEPVHIYCVDICRYI